MLTEILSLLREGNTFSLKELADRLNTDIQAVKAQMEYLERYGYIKKVEQHAECSNKCEGCIGCSNGAQSFAMWELA